MRENLSLNQTPTTHPKNNTMKKSPVITDWNRSKDLQSLIINLAILGAILAILAARIAYLLNN
jgi:hypothetical protein